MYTTSLGSADLTSECNERENAQGTFGISWTSMELHGGEMHNNEDRHQAVRPKLDIANCVLVGPVAQTPMCLALARPHAFAVFRARI